MEDDDEFGDLYTDVLRPLTASHPTHTVRTGAYPPLQSRPIDPDIDSDDEEILQGVADPKNSISSICPDPGQNSNSSFQGKTLPELEARPEHGGFSLNFDSNTKASVTGSAGLGSEAAVGSGRNESSGGFNFMEDEDDLNIVVEERENKDDAVVENDFNIMDKQEKTHSFVEQGENTGSYPAPGPGGETGPNQMIPGLSSDFKSDAGPNFEDEWESDDSEDDLQIVLNDSHHGPMGMERMPGMDDEDDDEDGDPLVIVADNSDMAHHHQQMLEERELGVEEGGPTPDGENKEPGDATKAGGAQPKIGYSNHLYHHHPFHSQFKYVRPGAAPLPGGIQGQVRPPVSVGPGAGRGRGDWRPRGPVPMQKGLHPGYGMPGWGPNTAGRGYGSGLDFTLPSHKTIFEVDIDGFEEKPWRLPGIDMSDFFNFGLNEEGWKDYCKQLEQLRLETTMQSKIRVYESGRMEQDYDPDLPPELAEAVGNQEVPSENGNAGIGEAGPSDIARASARVLPPVPVGRPIPVETGSGDRLPSIDTRRPRMHDSDAIIEIVCQSSNDDDDIAEQQGNDVVGEDIGGVDDIDVVKGDDGVHIDRSSHAYKGQKREIVERREELVSCDEIGRAGGPHKERFTNGRGQVRSSTKTNPSDDSDGEKQVTDNQNESFDSEDVKQNPPLSSDEGEPAVAIDDDDIHDDSVMDDEKILDTERENDESENSKSGGRVRSRHGGDHRKIHEDEVAEDQHYRPRPGSDFKRRAKEDEDGARGRGYREREDSHPWGGGTRRHLKGENVDHLRKRERVEDSRKRDSDRDNDSWRGIGHDRDVGPGPKLRDRDDLVKTHTEKADDSRGKRRKDGAYADRERGLEKEEKAYNHRESSRRKRERDDAHSKLKDDDTHYSRQKAVTQPVTTGARAPEEKKWIGHSRGKDDYKRSGRDYHSRSVRHGDQLKRRDRAEDDSFSRSRGREDANSRGNRQGSKDEKRAAYDRPSMNDERDVYASDASRQHEHNRQKLGSRKGKEFDSGERNLLISSEGNYNDGQSAHMGEMANLRAKTKQSNPETDRQPSKKHGEEASSDEEQQTSSRRGRSKFERWASHQERDLISITNPISSSSLRKTNKDSDTLKIVPASVSPVKNLEIYKTDLSSDNKDATAKPVMDDNKHLDTVEKLKKRSERFKLPMPGGKETVAVKKMESEPLASAQTEVRPDSEIKPERPPRKRRWTGN